MFRHEYHLVREQVLTSPLEEVFQYFADAGNLQELTPAWLHFHIHTPLPIEMGKDALIDYSLRLFAVPIRWRTQILIWDPPGRFVDIQLKGPYKTWRHTHEFIADPRGTRVIDRVLYELPIAPFGRLAHPFFVRPSLERIFDYRRDQMARRFDTIPLTPGT